MGAVCWGPHCCFSCCSTFQVEGEFFFRSVKLKGQQYFNPRRASVKNTAGDQRLLRVTGSEDPNK